MSFVGSALVEGAHTLQGPATGSGKLSTYIASFGKFTKRFALDRSSYGVWSTSTITGSKAGFRTNAQLTSRGLDFNFNCRFKLNSTTGVNFFVGFVGYLAATPPGTLLTTGTAADPLNSLDGIGVSLSSGNVKIAHNDISAIADHAATIFDDFTEPIVFESTTYDLTIASTNSTDGNIHMSLGTPDSDSVTAGAATSATLSSGLPGLSNNMEIQVFVETTTTETKSIEVYNCSGSF